MRALGDIGDNGNKTRTLHYFSLTPLVEVEVLAAESRVLDSRRVGQCDDQYGRIDVRGTIDAGYLTVVRKLAPAFVLT